MLSRPKAETGRCEGTVWGIPFKEYRNGHVRCGAPSGGSARESNNAPLKKRTFRPWRDCLEDRGPLAALNACDCSGCRWDLVEADRVEWESEAEKVEMASHGHDRTTDGDSDGCDNCARRSTIWTVRSLMACGDENPIGWDLAPAGGRARPLCVLDGLVRYESAARIMPAMNPFGVFAECHPT